MLNLTEIDKQTKDNQETRVKKSTMGQGTSKKGYFCVHIIEIQFLLKTQN